jgi:multidrug resistance protein MdtO
MIQVGEEATRGLLYAWLFVGIPAGVSVVVNLLLAPAPRRLAERAIARRLRVVARVLSGPDDPTRRELKQYLNEGIGTLQGHLRLAGIEGANPAKDLAALRQAASSCWALLSAVDVLESSPAAALPIAWCRSTAETLEEMAALLDQGEYPLEVQLERATAVGPLAAQLAAEIRDAVMSFTEVPPAPPKKHAHEGGFFLKDAFTNPAHVRYAVRTTAAALFCYALYTVLDWSAIHTCFLTCYIVSLGTTAESVEKLLLRITGCLIGSVAGIATIVFLMPSLTAISGLLLVVFLGTLAAAYVAAGSPRIAYAGYQIAFAFFLCILQGTGPALDVTVARDRIIGILIGNLVAYIALTRLWPVTVAGRINPAIAEQLQRLSRLLSAQDAEERRQLSVEVRTGLAAVGTDIELATYEPRMLRPSLTWLSTRRRAVNEAVALSSLLLLGCEQGAGLPESIVSRLHGAAERLEANTTAPPEGSPMTDPSSLQTLVDAHLHGMEEALAEVPHEQEEDASATV